MATFQQEMLKGRDISRSVRLKWNLKEQGGSVRWINPAQDGGQWLAVGNTVMMFNLMVSFSLRCCTCVCTRGYIAPLTLNFGTT
jgi:hypothetical protein